MNASVYPRSVWRQPAETADPRWRWVRCVSRAGGSFSPHLYVRSTAAPAPAPDEAPARSCLRVRVPPQRLRRVIRRDRLHLVITSRESGRVQIYGVRHHAGGLLFADQMVFRRAARRSLAMHLMPKARRHLRNRRRAVIDIDVYENSRYAEDSRHVSRRIVLR